MSADESIVFVVSGIAALIFWAIWYFQSWQITSFGDSSGGRFIFQFMPILCGVVLFAVLKLFASHDVRDDATYLLFYGVMGAAWVGAVIRVFHWLGLHSRDDVLERRNRAASTACGGALMGLTLCFAGGNIGDGPGWWVVVFSAILSSGAWLLLWVALAATTDVVDYVTVDHDRATGVRIAGYFIASGLVLGRAVAGNWESVESTVRDFALLGAPVLAWALAEFAMLKLFRPTPHNPTLNVTAHGFFPALAYVGAALAYVIWRRW